VPRNDKDFYETPEEARYPIMNECILEGAAQDWPVVLDLGCGDGRLGRDAGAAYNFCNSEAVYDKAHVTGIEVDPERAAIANRNGVEVIEAPLELVDWREFVAPHLVISNPPFSRALEFLEFAHDARDEVNCDVLFLLPVGYLGSQGRHAFWSKHQPDAMRVFSRRLSFTGDGKTANADYAWFYWGDALRGIDFYP
jgi:SAM-dependent methyltransferase